jgi:hypothetical protein
LIIFENNIFSVLDTPFNGELKLFALKLLMKMRQWDNEDINFSRSVYIIAFESKNEIQYKLTYKSELLAAMTKCTEKF